MTPTRPALFILSSAARSGVHSSFLFFFSPLQFVSKSGKKTSEEENVSIEKKKNTGMREANVCMMSTKNSREKKKRGVAGKTLQKNKAE